MHSTCMFSRVKVDNVSVVRTDEQPFKVSMAPPGFKNHRVHYGREYNSR